MTIPKKEDLLGLFGQSEHGNFYPIDTIPVPHPYCIGTKHVAHAADHYGGSLDRNCIEDGERRKLFGCETKFRGGGRCQLSFSDHETSLLIACKLDIKNEGKANLELHAWLLQIKDLLEPAGLCGVSFLDQRGK